MTPKTIILTGASRGLGLSILQILLSPPFSARVVTISRSLPQSLLALKESYPDQLELVQGDVAAREVSHKAVNVAKERWGTIDSVVLNAGVLEPLGKVADVDVFVPFRPWLSFILLSADPCYL